ncbi:MAG: tetratricopeptide repeat protein [Candidatus Muirbacterium halophilum]|nr:tetratricopeptide repeat protein [Candidatus Muirbacterium halophilum]
MKKIIFIFIFCFSISAFSAGNIDLLINLINFYNSNSQFEKSLEQAEKGLELEPNNAKLLELKEEILKKIQESKNKKEEKEEIIKNPSIKTDNIEAIENIIPKKKLRPFKYFSDAEKQKIGDILEKAIDLKSLGRNSDAKKKFEEVLKYDDLNEDANFYLGVLCVDEGKYDIAKTYFNNVLTYDQNNNQVLYWLGLVYMRENDKAKAKAYFLETVKKQPNSVLGYVQLASIYESENNVASAEKYYKKAIEVDKRLINIYKSLSDLYVTRSYYSKAIEVYREMINTFPKNAYGYSGLATMLLLTGDYENGAIYFQNAYKIDDKNPEVIALSAMYSFYAGKNAEAEERLGQAIEKEGDNLKIYRLIVNVLKNSSNIEGVKKYSEIGLQFFPLDSILNFELGKYYSNRNENEKALPYLEKSFQVDSEDSNILLTLAQTYNKAGYYVDSLNKYKILVNKFKDSKERPKWLEEARNVLTVYNKEKEIQIESPQSNFDDNAVYDFNIPQGF